MTLINEYADLQPGSDFMKKLEAALYEQVATIRAESANTANHDKRLTWARNVEQSPQEMVKRMKLAIGLRIASLPSPPAELNAANDTQIRNAARDEVNNFLGE